MKNPIYPGLQERKQSPPRRRRGPFRLKYALHVKIFHKDIDAGIIKQVGITAWAVYCVIARHANWQTGIACPTFETIKEKTGIKDNRTIRAAIEKLRDEGKLTFEFRRPVWRGIEYGRARYYYTLTKSANLAKFE